MAKRNQSHLPRFVILKHTPGDASPRSSTVHYDWMFECVDKNVLETYATEVIDWTGPPGEFSATKLSDHRIEYLQHEGPIGGDRGTVTQVVTGVYGNRSGNDQRKVYRLMCEKLPDFQMELVPIRAAHWKIIIDFRNEAVRVSNS